MEDLTKTCEVTSGKAEMTKTVVAGEMCRPAASHADVDSMWPCSGHDHDFSQIANCEVASKHKPERMEVCEDVLDTEVSPDFCSLLGVIVSYIFIASLTLRCCFSCGKTSRL